MRFKSPHVLFNAPTFYPFAPPPHFVLSLRPTNQRKIYDPSVFFCDQPSSKMLFLIKFAEIARLGVWGHFLGLTPPCPTYNLPFRRTTNPHPGGLKGGGVGFQIRGCTGSPFTSQVLAVCIQFVFVPRLRRTSMAPTYSQYQFEQQMEEALARGGRRLLPPTP